MGSLFQDMLGSDGQMIDTNVDIVFCDRCHRKHAAVNYKITKNLHFGISFG